MDFTKSAALALNRYSSIDYRLPFNLYPGYYEIYVYDIEQTGLVETGVGVGYPAWSGDLTVSETTSENGFQDQEGMCSYWIFLQVTET